MAGGKIDEVDEMDEVDEVGDEVPSSTLSI